VGLPACKRTIIRWVNMRNLNRLGVEFNQASGRVDLRLFSPVGWANKPAKEPE
jgi:hypothetical protein